MTTRVIQRNIHVSSRKANLVCALIRNKMAKEALKILQLTNKKTAVFLTKLLNGAISNATYNHAMDVEKLYLLKVVANQGPTLKRTNPRAKGSADRIRKRTTHLEVVLSDDLQDKHTFFKKAKKLVVQPAPDHLTNQLEVQ